jgi:hypothetical protein
MKLKTSGLILLISLSCSGFFGCTGSNSTEQNEGLPPPADQSPGEKIPFQRTGFSETCKAISKILKDTSNRKERISFFDGKSTSSLTFDSLGSILSEISLFDQSNEDYNLFKSNCNGLETLIWKQVSGKPPVIKRQSYVALTDFVINRNDFPKLIELRVIDSTRLTQLLIDDNVFTPNEGISPFKLQHLYAVMDSVKSVCKK